MKAITLLFTFLLTSLFTFAQTNDLPNRENYKLKLAVNDSNFYESDVKASPYVTENNTVQLYPGEKVFVEVELDKKNAITSMKTVKENLHPEKTITITFSQLTEGKKNKGMMLKVENPFKKKLEYKANIFLMESNKWKTTDVLPVQPKISSYEMWPDVVVTIALYGWILK